MINVDSINIDQSTPLTYRDRMPRFVGAAEAARQLGVQRSTLYAYVSRGLIERRVAVDGRTSLYSLDDVEQLAARSRRRSDAAPRPSLDVQIVTDVTVLDEDGVRYRGHDAAALATAATYEQVAELLWTGELPTGDVVWPPADDADRVAVRAVAGAPGITPLLAAAVALAARHGDDDPAGAARRLLTLVPDVLGADASRSGRVAERLAGLWRPDDGAFAAAVERALILLADHELATSTIAARLAASVRANPYHAIAAGLAVLTGPLHGASSAAVVDLLADCERVGTGAAVTARLGSRQRLAGFGHKIYAGTDPRVAPLLDAVATLDDPHGRRAVVDSLLAAAGTRIVHRPNIDLALGALLFVAGLPRDTPVFAVARIAGFAAHIAEEEAERPVRYRGLARPR